MYFIKKRVYNTNTNMTLPHMESRVAVIHRDIDQPPKGYS
jgi:hypothetical protein